LHIPIKILGACRFGADDAHGRTFGIGTEDAHDAGRDAEVHAAGNDGLLRFAGALGVHDFELKAVLLKMPARWPISDTEVSQLPRWPIASFTLSWADAAEAAQNVKAANTPASVVFLIVNPPWN